jgi:hypothetical protein
MIMPEFTARPAITFIRQNPFGALLAVGLALALVKLYGLYTSVEVDDGHWQQFKAEHHCVLQTGGQGTGHVSWLCDDGQTYYRWRQQQH